MTEFQRLHMPSLAAATGWLDTEPPGPAELQGHIVVVNFWTLSSAAGDACNDLAPSAGLVRIGRRPTPTPRAA